MSSAKQCNRLPELLSLTTAIVFGRNYWINVTVPAACKGIIHETQWVFLYLDFATPTNQNVCR